MRTGGKLGAAVVAVLAVTAISRIAAHRDPDDKPDPKNPAAAGANAAGRPAHPTPAAPAEPAEIDPNSFYKPTRLQPGQRPPQFIIVSFDGAGSHEKWGYWKAVGEDSSMRFTGFLSGVYLVDEAHRTAYRGPGHRPGASDVGFADDPAAVSTLITDLNDAWARGHEIGTHYNGHFCDGSGYSVAQWNSADWGNELGQFFGFYADYQQVNALAAAPTLRVPAKSIQGGRTPCLQRRPDQLFAALRARHMSYDSSGVSEGLSWPVRKAGIWEFPLHYVPLAGAHSGVIAMDYNFWFKQTGGSMKSPHSQEDSNQVLQTYRNMFNAAYSGNRAPMVLGNHFNSWNNNAYSMALSNFVAETCGKKDVQCVPYRDVIRWMEMQTPAVLAQLQSQPAVYRVNP